MDDCIFCKIIAGELPSTKVHEDEYTLAFRDIHPAAPVHIIVIPKKHISSVMELGSSDDQLLSQVFQTIKIVAHKLNVAEDGFRLVANTGKNGGQTVPHLHFHVLGEKEFHENFG